MDPYHGEVYTLDDLIRGFLKTDYWIKVLSLEVKKLKGDLACHIGNRVELNRRLLLAKVKLQIRKRVVISAARASYCEIYRQYNTQYRMNE